MGALLQLDLATAAPAGTVGTRISQQDFMRRLAPYLPALKRFALRLTGNREDSEDLLQDLLLKLFERPERLADIDLMQPWLLRVMYHQFIDRCRRNAPQGQTVSIDQLADEDGGDPAAALALTDDSEVPENVVERLELARVMSSAIGHLPEPQQALVRMHDIDGLSLGEISARCGLSINTVKSSLSRARVRLRQDLLGGTAARGTSGSGNRRRRAAVEMRDAVAAD